MIHFRSGVVLAAVWASSALARAQVQSPPTANQSASIDPVAEPAMPPAEAEKPESPAPRSRRAVRKPGAESAIRPLDQGTPWYRTGLGATTIVLALLGGLYLGVRRWVPTVKTGSNPAMSVVARSVVTPRHSVATVQWGRRFVLVGVSNDRMDALSEVADPTEAAELAGRLGVRFPAGGSSFDDALMTETSAFDEPEPPRSQPPVQRNAVNELLQRLRKLRSA